MKIKPNVFLSLLSLFFIYTLFCLYRQPTISDSLILLVIGTLVGFFHYIKFITPATPTPKEVSQEILNMHKQIEKLQLDKEVAMLNYDIYKLHASATTVKSREADAKKPFVF